MGKDSQRKVWLRQKELAMETTDLNLMILDRMKLSTSQKQLCRFGRVHAEYVRCFNRTTREFCRELPQVKYSEDQPRDDHGRWSDSGGEGIPGLAPNPAEGHAPVQPPAPTVYRMQATHESFGQLADKDELQYQDIHGNWIRNPEQPGTRRVGPMGEAANGKPQELGTDGQWHTLETRVNEDGTVEVRDMQFGEWQSYGRVGDQQMKGDLNLELQKNGKWETASTQPGDERTSSNGHTERMNSNGNWQQQSYTPSTPSQESDSPVRNRGRDYEPPNSTPADPNAGTKQDSKEQLSMKQQAITDFEQKGGGINKVYKVTFEDGKEAAWKPGPYKSVYDLPDADHIHDQAASDLAGIVKMHDIVPEATIRTIDGVDGSLQAWKSGEEGLGRQVNLHDARRALSFDYVIGNFDRHGKNYLVTPVEGSTDLKPVLVDNGLSMPRAGEDLGLRNTVSGDGGTQKWGVNTGGKVPLSIQKTWQKSLDKWAKTKTQLQRSGLSDSAVEGIHERITAITQKGAVWGTLAHFGAGW